MMTGALLVSSGLRLTPGLAACSTSALQVERGVARVTCAKQGIHPQFYPEAKVYCNGELVMTCGGTKEEYVVDVWSGNHPFYQGAENVQLKETGRVDKFKQRYGTMGSLSTVPVLTKGEIVIAKKSKPMKKGGKK